jgi:endonuclease-3
MTSDLEATAAFTAPKQARRPRHGVSSASEDPLTVLPHQPFVVGGLLEFGSALAARSTTSRQPSQADDLIRAEPFAFVVAILLDQSVPAERAWTAPLLLKQRLGSLLPAFVLGHAAALRAALSETPMPHRYPARAASWILAAAAHVESRYSGDAARIWSDTPTAIQLRSRLEDFLGIGQKKAAMAVEILAAEGHEIAEMGGSDVAYDVHVRRVFLRTGLVDVDTSGAVVAAARRLHPGRPGALDLPAWVIGRNWCRPTRPKCNACPIAWACPSGAELAGDARRADQHQ